MAIPVPKKNKDFIKNKNHLEHFAQEAIFAAQLRIGLWCNGNTADFGSVILGSSPGRPTKK